MPGAFPTRARLLEFAVVAAVLAILAAVLLAALLRIEEEAEKVVVEATVRNMDSGLRLAQAQLLTQQRESEARTLLTANPVAWLERPPAGYAGEVEGFDPARLDRGQWLWDRAAATLYYRPRRDDGLRAASGGWLAWRVMAPGGVGGDRERPGTLRVVAMIEYEWRP